jgi:hypothetical protein
MHPRKIPFIQERTPYIRLPPRLEVRERPQDFLRFSEKRQFTVKESI